MSPVSRSRLALRAVAAFLDDFRFVAAVFPWPDFECFDVFAFDEPLLRLPCDSRASVLVAATQTMAEIASKHRITLILSKIGKKRRRGCLLQAGNYGERRSTDQRPSL